MGSTGLDKLKEQNTGGNNPGVEGALDVDPDVIGGYTCATAEAAGVKFELTTLAKMGRFDQEVSIDMPAASDIPRLETITVKPVCMGFEDFYAGLTVIVSCGGDAVVSGLHAIETTRLHQRRRWVVSGPNLSRFGCDSRRVDGV